MPVFFDQWQNKPPRPVVSTPDPVDSKVQQHFKDQLEINNIMKRAQNGGFLPPAPDSGMYLDMSCTDFREARDMLLRAREAFDRLPSDLRLRFGNDPAKACAWLSDPLNADEAIRLHMKPKPVQQPIQQPVQQPIQQPVQQPDLV